MTTTLEPGQLEELISLRRNIALQDVVSAHRLPDGRHLALRRDFCPASPREYADSRLLIYPNREFGGGEKLSRDEIDEEMKQARESLLAVFPVRAYAHGGIALTVKDFKSYPFTDRFDSAWCGWWIASESLMEECKGDKDQLLERAEDEVKMYAAYVNGEVYGYILYDGEWKVENSCWGFNDAFGTALDAICDHIGVKSGDLEEIE